MANTGNTQQQINYGASANDGNGDPLRTAFIKTDDNFDNIWLAGPVGSNIIIANNTIQVNNTNGNLILQPNGVGVIQTNSKLLPRLNNTYDLGSTTLKYRAGYFGPGGLTVDGNVTVTGNLTAGNISYTGNVFVGDLQGSVYADDSTIMVDAVDNELFASQATISGNVSATYFIGNGSSLTGITSSYGNANVVTLLAGFGSNTVSTTGNITANYFIGNGSQLTGITSYANANAVAFGESGWTGNIIPSGNAVYSLGNSTNQWNDLYVSNATIFMNNVPLSLTAGNVLTVNGNAVLQNNSNSTISTTGNITAGNVSATGNISGAYIKGNGGELTNLPPPTVTQDITSNGAMSIMTYDGVIKYVSYATVEPASGNIAAGNISTTGNISGNYFVGNGSQLTGIITNTGNVTFTDTTISTNSAAAGIDVFLRGGTATGCGAPGGNSIILSGLGAGPFDSGNVVVKTGNSHTNIWEFDATGNLTAPGNVSAVGNITAGNISISGTGNVTGNLVGRVMTGTQSAITSLGTLTNINTNGNANVAQTVNSTTVVATGNVSGGNISTAGNITGNTAGFAIGYRDIPQVSFTGNATIATTDAGKHYYSTLSTGNVLTIANNASQGFQIGAAITVVNQGTGTITVAQGSGVTLYLAGNATAGNRSVSTFGMATIMKVATNTWFINGTGVS